MTYKLPLYPTRYISTVSFTNTVLKVTSKYYNTNCSGSLEMCPTQVQYW